MCVRRREVGLAGAEADDVLALRPCSALALASTARVADSAMAARRADVRVHVREPTGRRRQRCRIRTLRSGRQTALTCWHSDRRGPPPRSTHPRRPAARRRPVRVRPLQGPPRAGRRRWPRPARTVLGTSHRQAPVKHLVGVGARRADASCSGCPTGGRSCSATAAPPCSGTSPRSASIEQRSQHARVRRVLVEVRRGLPPPRPHLGDPTVDRAATPATTPTPTAVDGVDVYALTHNETSTGVAMELRRPGRRSATRSSPSTPRRRAGGLPWDPAEVDVYYFAPQKCFASDGGLWLAACSPAAVERIERIAAIGPLAAGVARPRDRPRQQPRRPDLQHAGARHARAARRADPVDARQRRPRLVRRAQPRRRRRHLYGWAEARDVGDAVRRRPGQALGRRRHHRPRRRRSTPTTVCAALRANGIVDTDSYRKLGRNQLRIGMFPAIEPADVEALTACIDHVVEHDADSLAPSGRRDERRRGADLDVDELAPLHRRSWWSR